MTVTNDIVVPLQHADRFFINGGWVAPSSDATIDVIDSSTEQIYFKIAEAQASDIDRAVTAARRGVRRRSMADHVPCRTWRVLEGHGRRSAQSC